METPSFSIIVPTRDRINKVASCVGAIHRLDYPPERIETIVVDDGTLPSGGVESALASLCGSLPLRVLRQEGKGPASARNAGAAAARSEYLAFIDDDCRPRRDWLRAFARHFQDAPQSVAGGCTLNALTDNPWAVASQAITDYIRRYSEETGQPFHASNNLALSRGTFQGIGGFEERFPLPGGEDRDFCDRCLHGGHPLRWVPDAVADHYHALSFRLYLKQHFNYGRGAFLYSRIRAARRNRRVSLQPLRFYRDLVFYPFASKALKNPVRLSFLLLLSQAAIAAGFSAQKCKRDRALEDRVRIQ